MIHVSSIRTMGQKIKNAVCGDNELYKQKIIPHEIII